MCKSIARQLSLVCRDDSSIVCYQNITMHQPASFKKNIRDSILMRGFTLIEILVAILVLSIGLLGLAGLQAMGLQSNHSGYLRSQATIFAYEMADRLRANRATAIAGNYDISLTGSPPSGSTIQDVDRADWLNRLATTLPAGDGAIACTTTTTNGETTCSCAITVQWNDTRKSGESQQFIVTTQI